MLNKWFIAFVFNFQRTGFARYSQISHSGFKVDRLDHFVITVKDLNKTVDFYTRVLGMEVTTFKVSVYVARNLT